MNRHSIRGGLGLLRRIPTPRSALGARASIASSSASSTSRARPSAFAARRLLPLAIGMGAVLSLMPTTAVRAEARTSDPAAEMVTTPRDSHSLRPSGDGSGGGDGDTRLPSSGATGTGTGTGAASASLSAASLPTLLRAYLVYTACSFPLLIDHAPSLLHALTHSPIPGLKPVTEALVRYTFFAQFVPGETAADCLPEMRALRARRVGSVLNYSAEAECEEGDVRGLRDAQRARLEEVYRALEGLGRFEDEVKEGEGRGSSAFALKVTGLIDPPILHRASNTLLRLRPLSQSNAASSPRSAPVPPVPYPGTPLSADRAVVAPGSADSGGGAREAAGSNIGPLLSLKGAVQGMGVLAADEGLQEGDLQELQGLWETLRKLGGFARDQGVKLMIDAEHTWFQPALDAYTLLLSEEFNRPPKNGKGKWDGPLIYGTYQSYLTRQPQHLAAAIRHAEDHGYALGLKIVRGAYFVQERKRWKDEGREGLDPIWCDKPSTDKCYNTAVTTVISTLARQLSSSRPELALQVVFGTHNPESCDVLVESLQEQGLASRVEEGTGVLRLREDVRGKVFVAQLYGMKDDLTDRMAGTFEDSGMPVALKYIAYGNLGEVMPFLGRRAIENKSVMSGQGGAAAERKRLSGELWRRLIGRS